MIRVLAQQWSVNWDNFNQADDYSFALSLLTGCSIAPTVVKLLAPKLISPLVSSKTGADRQGHTVEDEDFPFYKQSSQDADNAVQPVP